MMVIDRLAVTGLRVAISRKSLKSRWTDFPNNRLKEKFLQLIVQIEYLNCGGSSLDVNALALEKLNAIAELQSRK